MNTEQDGFKPLPLSTLKWHTGYVRPFHSAARRVAVSASALEVMTDLNFVSAAVVKADIDIESATQKMISRSVRSLLVTDSADNIIGIVTSRDLIGERPHRLMQQRAIGFSDLQVRDIMTPADEIEVIPLDDVLHARVGDIVMTLKHSHRQHALVVEEVAISGNFVIRGIFSATQIARQLGIALQQHELFQTFAEIERVIKPGVPAKADQPI